MFNTLRPRQNGRRFADDVFKCIFLNENVWISLKLSLKFVPKVPINNIPTLVQILAWRRSRDKSLSEAMMVSLLTHICVTRSQWDNKGFCPLWHLITIPLVICMHHWSLTDWIDIWMDMLCFRHFGNFTGKICCYTLLAQKHFPLQLNHINLTVESSSITQSDHS